MEVIHYLLGYENLYIIQDTDKFRFSLDSILLPNFIQIPKNISSILDIGCGNAPIPLVLSTKTSAKIVGIEIQKESYDLACKTVKMNHLENQIELIHGDARLLEYHYNMESFDVITCNPPYFPVHIGSHVNQNEAKTIARHEVCFNLDDLLRISRKLLKNNGILGMVHRPERLVDIVEKMRQYHIEPKRICFVYPKKGENANILLIEGRKNGKPGLKLLSPLYVHEENGDYTEQVLSYFKAGE